jgi:hypothetical protein
VHTQPADLDASYRSLAFWLDSLPGPLLPRPALKSRDASPKKSRLASATKHRCAISMNSGSVPSS